MAATPCTIDGQIAEYAGDVELKDCGDLEYPPLGARDEVAWTAARDCILAVDLARTLYVVRYEEFTIEGANR